MNRVDITMFGIDTTRPIPGELISQKFITVFLIIYVHLQKLFRDGTKSEIVYQPEGSVSLEVRLENETVWLTQQQMSELFQTTKQNISLHTGNIFKEKELDRDSVVKESFTTASDGKSYRTKYYNLDVIISVGYRVKSQRSTQFRQWANKVLKEYMLKGYSINQKLDSLEKRIDNRLREHDSEIQRLSNQVDFFVRHSLPPIEGIFFAGQIFDAYKFVCDLVKSARKSIVLFDNYIDESVLTLFKRGKSVSVVIYTDKITPAIRFRHQAIQRSIFACKGQVIHKGARSVPNHRWGNLGHIGASLKDLGKKLFAFSKISAIPPEIIYKQIDS